MISSDIRDVRGNGIKIVIIDSGVCENHASFDGFQFQGISLAITKEGKIKITDNYTDKIGHGTAVADIIHKQVPDSQLFIIKIYDSIKKNYDDRSIIHALRYIYENIECDLINISMGVLNCTNKNEFEEVCNILYKKKTYIVSAFDNNGTISYPAAFNSVIGVDSYIGYTNMWDYDFIEDSIITVRGFHKEQRLAWINNTYEVVSGSSFVAPYITSLIAKFLSKNKEGDVLNFLRENARHVVCANKRKSVFHFELFEIKNAVVFPFNKEVHSLIRFSDQATFNILHVLDTKYLGNINRLTSEVIGDVYGKDYIIENIDKLSWDENFDTFILGHVNEINLVLNKDYKEIIIEKCIEYKKNLYSFSPITDKDLVNRCINAGIKLSFPCITVEDKPHNRFGKLKSISTPTIGVFGTSPKQGKFTTQLGLCREFSKLDYKTYLLGSEPTTPLFGYKYVYPMGYDSFIKLYEYDSIMAINYIMEKIEEESPELIIVGSQSQSIPFTDSNINLFPIKQYEFLLGTSPDVFILCVNFEDEMSYIKRTICYLENLLPSKVIALSLFPFEKTNKWTVMGNRNKRVPKYKILFKMLSLYLSTRKPIVLCGEKGVRQLVKMCINYLSK